MPYVIDPTGKLSIEVPRIAFERLDEAIAELERLDGADRADVERGVHAARKRCKEARALARFVRARLGSEYERFNREVREAADALAPIRDSHALLATFDELRSGRDDDLLDRVREGQAESASVETRSVAGGDPRIAQAVELLERAHTSIERWDIGDDDWVLWVGLRDTYHRGRRAFQKARSTPDDDHVHEWRKAVKHLWYQVRLIERTAPSVLSPLIGNLDDLAEALGDDHDLAVLIGRMRSDPERFGGKTSVKRARRLARAEQDELRRRAFRLARTLYAESPHAFTQRMSAYWRQTVRQGPELPTGGLAELIRERDEPAVDAPAATPSTIERERKFLVAGLPTPAAPGSLLRQGYLAIDGTVSVRVREAGVNECTLTVKAGRGAVRTEIEVPLDPEQFASAWDHTEGRRISKTRHVVDLDGVGIEVDVFHDDLDGLVMAEVEFDSEEAMAAFVPPDWFGAEVTDDDAYTNASLALRGRPTLAAAEWAAPDA